MSELCKCGHSVDDHLWDINPWPESEPEWEALACRECGESPDSNYEQVKYVCEEYEEVKMLEWDKFDEELAFEVLPRVVVGGWYDPASGEGENEYAKAKDVDWSDEGEYFAGSICTGSIAATWDDPGDAQGITYCIKPVLDDNGVPILNEEGKYAEYVLDGEGEEW